MWRTLGINYYDDIIGGVVEQCSEQGLAKVGYSRLLSMGMSRVMLDL